MDKKPHSFVWSFEIFYFQDLFQTQRFVRFGGADAIYEAILRCRPNTSCDFALQLKRCITVGGSDAPIESVFVCNFVEIWSFLWSELRLLISYLISFLDMAQGVGSVLDLGPSLGHCLNWLLQLTTIQGGIVASWFSKYPKPI